MQQGSDRHPSAILVSHGLVGSLYNRPNILTRFFCNRWNYFNNPRMAQKLPAVIYNV
jgi:hypothetical protein